MVFIQTKLGVAVLKEYILISLIGGVYKIIVKLLSEILKEVENMLVYKHQMAS